MEVEVTPAKVTQQILNLRAGILRLTAVLADGGKPLEEGVAFTVYTAARDAEGNRKRVTGSNQYSGPPRFPLPAGRYFVTAEYGSASADVEVEVTPAEVTQQILNLRAGILRLTAVLADGGKPLEEGVAYTVYTAARDAEGNRKRVTGSNQYSGPPRFPLPAGRYFVTAEHGSASANVEVEITPAGVTQQILNLRAGILRLTAVLADGGKPLAEGVAYTVYTAARDAEGNRQRVTYSNQYSGPPRLAAPGRSLLRDRRAPRRERQRRDGDHGRRNSRRSTTNRASQETVTPVLTGRAAADHSIEPWLIGRSGHLIAPSAIEPSR